MRTNQVSTARGSGWVRVAQGDTYNVRPTHPLPRAVLTAMPAQGVWSREEWALRERRAREDALRSRSEQGAWRVLNREARRVMRAYTTSFFIVSRFLPRAKREEVEAVYAAVRYPDEVVDTFPI